QFDQRRRAAPPFSGRTVIVVPVVAQAQCTDPAEVVYSQQVVHFGECRKAWILAPAPGMVSRDDAAAPGVGRGVGDGAMEHRIVGRGRATELIAQVQPQIGRDIEMLRVAKPGLFVCESTVLALPLAGMDQGAELETRL